MIAMRNRSRNGFTLIELIVAMSVIVILSSIALLVVPDIMAQDRTTEGASRLQQYLMIAKARATRDKLPRGIRLLSKTNNSASPSGMVYDPLLPSTPANLVVATELQYIESPPVYIPPDPTVATSPGPRVRLSDLTSSGNWIIVIENLPDSSVVVKDSIVFLPTLGTWFTINTVTSGSPNPSDVTVTAKPNTGITSAAIDPNIGVGTQIVTYQFGIFGAAQPMLGEPVQQLPSNVSIDLTSSSGLSGGDLLFTPSGDLMDSGSGQVFLWVRDITKQGGSSGTFAQGGEQQVVAIKSRSGAVGAFPIAWTGDPFQFAK